MYTRRLVKTSVVIVMALAVLPASAQTNPKPPSLISIDDMQVPAAVRDLLFDDGFEWTIPLTDIDVDHPLYKRVTDGMGVTEISAKYRREGASSLRVQLAKSGTNNYRQELRLRSASDDMPMAGSGEYWYGESICIPPTSSLASDSVLTQWHTHYPTSGHSPLLGVRVLNSNLQITREATSFESLNLGPVKTGEWMDWVYQVLWRTTNTGRIRIWLNGKLVYDKVNLQTAWEGEPNQPRLLVGRYSSAWKRETNGDANGTSHESYHDVPRICQGEGCSYMDVAPRGDRLATGCSS